ncbi:MAG: hypothetical protein V1882_02545 [Candidatus Omnitrophota bacterium]
MQITKTALGVGKEATEQQREAEKARPSDGLRFFLIMLEFCT